MIAALLAGLIIAQPVGRVTRRTAHVTDTVTANDGKTVTTTRRIQNHSNREHPNGRWSPVALPRILTASTAGGFDAADKCRWGRTRGRVRACIGISDNLRRPKIRISLHRNPAIRMVSIALTAGGVVAGPNDPEVRESLKAVRWVGVFGAGTILKYRFGPAGIRSLVILAGPAAATVWRFGVWTPPAFELVDASGRFVVRRKTTLTEVFQLSQPWGSDSATDGSNIDGTNPVPVSMVLGGTRVIGAKTFRIVRYEADTSGVTAWPVVTR